MPSIYLFLKFGSQKDILDLYENGTVYMNPIQYFRKFEDGELRGDKYEGISKIRNYLPGQFEIPSIEHTVNYLGIHLTESYEEVLGNIYSLFCVSSKGWSSPIDFSIDQRIKKFGTHCLMIKDNRAFLSLMEQHLSKLNIKFRHGFVDYYDKEKANKDISLFEKPFEFEYQKEFRFYVERKSTEPFSFSIGSLQNISELFLADTIVDELKITPKQTVDK
jgi:hypothetical protein